MESAELRLKDKTVLLAGPLTRWSQSLAHKLTQAGSNIVFFHESGDFANRFANQLNEAREINERFGKAGAVEVDHKSEKSVKDSVSRAAEFFGGLDIFLDAQFAPAPLKFTDLKSTDALVQATTQNLGRTLNTLYAVMPFLAGRKRGRIVFVVPQSWSAAGPFSLLQSSRGGLLPFAQALTKELTTSQCTVNCIDIGLTDELLLSLFPGKTVMKALEELRVSNPQFSVTEPDRVADGLIFFMCGLSQGVSGQLLNIF